MRLGQRNAEAAKYQYDKTGKQRQVLWDEDLKGFGLRVAPSGKRTWIFRYKVQGRQRWLTIGKYPGMSAGAARKRAKKHSVAVDDGQDPAQQRKKRKRDAEITLGDLCDEYLETKELTLKASTLRCYRQLIDAHIRPAFGKLPPQAITESDVERFYHKMRDRLYMANRTLHTLRAVMALAERRGLREPGTDPTRHIERYRERARDRFLSPDELGRIGAAIAKLEASGKISESAAAALRLLSFTGCRVSEILRLQWNDVDRERGFLHLVDAKAGPRSVVLTAPAIEVLEALETAAAKRDLHTPWVIPGQRPNRPMQYLSRPWRRVCRAAKVEHARMHDLRHSHGAWAASSGHSLLLIGALLGHRNAQSTERYAHLGDDPVRAAAESVATGIAAAMAGGGGELVDLEERRRG